MTRFASVVLVDARGWLLLQERDDRAAIDPGKWGYCGGHVEEGEDFAAGAYRELAEETGVRLDDGLRLFGEFDVLHDGRAHPDRVQLFATGVDLRDEDVTCHEGRQIVFVEPGRALGLDLTAAARISLPEFLRSETYAGLAR